MEFWTAPENWPFAVALAVMLLLAIVQFIGLGDMLGGDGDADLDADLDADAGGEAGLDGGLLALLGIGRMPLLMWLMIALTVFGLVGYSGQQLMVALTGGMLSAWLAAPLAAVAALPLTGLIARPIAAIMPRDETTAVSLDSLVGRFATISVGTASTGSPARATVKDVHGLSHNIMVEPDNDGQVLRTGESILLVRREKGVFRAISRGDTYLPRLDS